MAIAKIKYSCSGVRRNPIYAIKSILNLILIR